MQHDAMLYEKCALKDGVIFLFFDCVFGDILTTGTATLLLGKYNAADAANVS